MQSPNNLVACDSSAIIKVLDNAGSISKDMHDEYIAQDHLLLALIKDPSISALFKEAGLSESTLKSAVQQIRGNRRVESKSAEQGFDALGKYAIDLTKLAEEGKLDPVIGRVCRFLFLSGACLEVFIWPYRCCRIMKSAG